MARRGDGVRPLKLTKIHTLLTREHALQASYDTLWRFAHQELAWREKPSTVRIDDPPAGQEAQVDFGRMGCMIDPDSGRKRALWVLVVTLVGAGSAPELRTRARSRRTGAVLAAKWHISAARARTLAWRGLRPLVLGCPTCPRRVRREG